MLKSRASADRSALRRAIEDRDRSLNRLVTTSAKRQISKGVLPATFVHLTLHSSTVWAAEALLRELR